MPRYNYQCSACQECMELMHSMSIVMEDCPKCESKGTLVKQLNIPNLNIGKVKSNKVGGVVKNAIEEYRKLNETEKHVWDDLDIEKIIQEKSNK